jgi:hypothetical protein
MRPDVYGHIMPWVEELASILLSGVNPGEQDE